MSRGAVVLLLSALLGVASVAVGLRGREASGPLPACTVRVWNGCGVDGLAGRAASALRSLGQDVVIVEDAPHHGFARSVLVDHRGRPALSRRIAAALGEGLLVVEERRESPPADLTLLLGADHATLDLPGLE